LTELEGTATQSELALGYPARLIPIPSSSDHRGTLSVIDWAVTLPFTPQRLYYIHEVAMGTRRAGHAHFRGEELILSLSGSISVVVDNGHARHEFTLDRPDIGLHIPRLVWHEVHSFSRGAVCAVLASGHHREDDYCRDYQQFLEQRPGPTPLRPVS
jgi:hypothetical protein